MEIAKEIRRTVLSMIYKAQVSHIGSNFSSIEILCAVYSGVDFKKDKLVVSKGWVAATIYALNVKYGLMPQEAVDTFCIGDSQYIGLIEPLGVFGCDIAGGSMQLGIAGAVGLALSKKLKGEGGFVYCLLSDGEIAGGLVWESSLIAAHHKLNNLIVCIDNNKLQAMGKSKEILQAEFPSAGWNSISVDGHDQESIEKTLEQARLSKKPSVIICDTIKGKGVSFMENNNLYHYKQLSEEEYEAAKRELNV